MQCFQLISVFANLCERIEEKISCSDYLYIPSITAPNRLLNPLPRRIIHPARRATNLCRHFRVVYIVYQYFPILASDNRLIPVGVQFYAGTLRTYLQILQYIQTLPKNKIIEL